MGSATRVEWLTPNFRPDELVCMGVPRGQLPSDASAEQVSLRIEGIDEAGEDCRQKLERAKLKIEVTEEVVNEMNSRSGKKKPR
ncbi:hypothetical protein vBCbaSRXM_128 [Citromicrobium phage vB_CbaS-RXM]|nr:hypothetical protein vBCbaSRXM_128 [Citromicrobium phage vB_CbaS-RXM]